jgi:ethanolamine transporter EutH
LKLVRRQPSYSVAVQFAEKEFVLGCGFSHIAAAKLGQDLGFEVAQAEVPTQRLKAGHLTCPLRRA